jgi:hypothetical protein
LLRENASRSELRSYGIYQDWVPECTQNFWDSVESIPADITRVFISAG